MRLLACDYLCHRRQDNHNGDLPNIISLSPSPIQPYLTMMAGCNSYIRNIGLHLPKSLGMLVIAQHFQQGMYVTKLSELDEASIPGNQMVANALMCTVIINISLVANVKNFSIDKCLKFLQDKISHSFIEMWTSIRYL